MSIFPSSMPYDDVNIIDQSGYTEETVVETPYIPSGPIAYIPFISPRGYGEDNKLQYMTGSKLAKYGNPNLKKYGLSLYLAKRFIEGGGTVLGMRVTNENFRHANFCISAVISKATQCKYSTLSNSINGISTYHPVFISTGSTATEYTFDEIFITTVNDISTIKVTVNGVDTALNTLATTSVKFNGAVATATVVKDEDGNVSGLTIEGVTLNLVTGDAFTVKFIKSVITGDSAASIDGIKGAFASGYTRPVVGETTTLNTTIDNTTITIPLFFVAAKAAGTFGNYFKGRFAIDTAQNSYIDSNDDSAYCYKFIDSDNNAKLDNNISFAFNDDYMYKNESMSIEEVFGKYTENVTMVKMNSFDDFLAFVAANCCDADNVAHKIKDANKVDIFFGSNMNTDNYYVDMLSADAINLSTSVGIQFGGGAEETTKFSFNSDPFASVLADAYNGVKTDLIYDHIRYPFQYLFCPSADPDVMEAVHNLATINRKCTRASYFVCGGDTEVPPTYEDARAQKSTIPANSWKEDIIPEWARISDSYTGRKVFMPSVYFTAFAYPKQWNSRKGKPLAGRMNAIWTGFDVGTVTPASSNTQEYISNHNVGYNTMIEDGLGNAVMYEQITAQTTTSRLSEINNAQVLCEMVKIALKLASDNRWSDLGDDEISNYKTTVESEISTQLRGCYETMSVVATREAVNGASRNRILCKINVLFKDMLKGVSYEFYILAQ